LIPYYLFTTTHYYMNMHSNLTPVLIRLSLVVLACAALSACASRKAQVGKEEIRMANPAVSVEPLGYREAPRVGRVPQEPIPVIKNPKVVRVYYAPYVNEKGEAFPGGYKYVISEGVSWNMEALRNPDLAYIPAENAEPVPSYQGMNYTPMQQSSTEPAGAPLANTVSPLLMFDMEAAKFSGYVNPEEEDKARALANSNETVLFDPNLGWIIVPKTALRRPGSRPGDPVLPNTAPPNSGASVGPIIPRFSTNVGPTSSVNPAPQVNPTPQPQAPASMDSAGFTLE
jgi:hypothetical protein